jgi:hypothetical protein
MTEKTEESPEETSVRRVHTGGTLFWVELPQALANELSHAPTMESTMTYSWALIGHYERNTNELILYTKATERFGRDYLEALWYEAKLRD